MPFFDLDLLQHSFLAYCWPFFSCWLPALVWFRCRDYLDSQSPKDLSCKVRKLVSKKLNKQVKGPVRLLTHPRYFGVTFNPVSFFYVFDESGKSLEAVVALISNIPWLESHVEVLVPRDADYDGSLSSLLVMKSHPKDFHVSPFIPMQDIEYHWCFSIPSENLRVTVLLKNNTGRNILFASLHVNRHAWSLLSLLTFLICYPLMTWKVIFAIHWVCSVFVEMIFANFWLMHRRLTNCGNENFLFMRTLIIVKMVRRVFYAAKNKVYNESC